MTAPELPVPNLPLLRKVLDLIDANPEQWDQDAFEYPAECVRADRAMVAAGKCGTTRCVAGWVDFLTLGKVSHDTDNAQRELGLTADETEALFFATADHDHGEPQRRAVQAVCERIAARAGETL